MFWLVKLIFVKWISWCQKRRNSTTEHKRIWNREVFFHSEVLEEAQDYVSQVLKKKRQDWAHSFIRARGWTGFRFPGHLPLIWSSLLMLERTKHNKIRHICKKEERKGSEKEKTMGPSWRLCSELLWTAGRENVGCHPRPSVVTRPLRRTRRGSPRAVLPLS